MGKTSYGKTRASLSHTLLALEDPSRRLEGLELDTLSDLPAGDLNRFQGTWYNLSSTRRRSLITQLIELAEDRVDVSFRNIYSWLLGDDDSWIRAKAIEGLWEEEDIRLLEPLLQLLEQDPDPEVRAAAALFLGRFVLQAELEEIDPSQAQRAYEALLGAFAGTETDLLVRRRALESLAYSGEPRVQELIQIAYGDDDESMRASALFAMGRSADPRWRVIILEELGSRDPVLCFEAARASGELEIADAVPQLITLLNEDDIEIRDTAVWALGRIGGPEARRALRACCAAGDDESLVEAAEEALAELDFLSGDSDLPAFIFDS